MTFLLFTHNILHVDNMCVGVAKRLDRWGYYNFPGNFKIVHFSLTLPIHCKPSINWVLKVFRAGYEK